MRGIRRRTLLAGVIGLVAVIVLAVGAEWFVVIERPRGHDTGSSPAGPGRAIDPASPPAGLAAPTPAWGSLFTWTYGKRGVRFDFNGGTLGGGVSGGASGGAFDGAATPARDGAGLLAVQEQKAAGGGLRRIARGGGWAVRFPAACDPPLAQCPKAILATFPAPWLNPGTQRVRWGAAVLMSPNEASAGSNLVQKGYSVEGTQFKLQVDGSAAQPSCVLAGPQAGRNQIFRAVSRSGVADGRWHRLGCERNGGWLVLMVDGVRQARTAVPPNLSIANDVPLRIGGKGVVPNNDQFHGALDDVYVAIG